jgi:hypothetical protein
MMIWDCRLRYPASRIIREYKNELEFQEVPSFGIAGNVEGAERDFGALHAAVWNNSQLTREGVAHAASFLCHHGDQVGWFDRIAKGHASLDSFVWEFCLRFVIKETG